MLMQYLFLNLKNDKTNSCSSSIAELIYKFHKHEQHIPAQKVANY